MRARGLGLDTFKEGDHPRAQNGQFGSGGKGGGSQGGREGLIKQIEKDLSTPGMYNDRNDRRKDQRELARLKSGKQKLPASGSQRLSSGRTTTEINPATGLSNEAVKAVLAAKTDQERAAAIHKYAKLGQIDSKKGTLTLAAIQIGSADPDEKTAAEHLSGRRNVKALFKAHGRGR